MKADRVMGNTPGYRRFSIDRFIEGLVASGVLGEDVDAAFITVRQGPERGGVEVVVRADGVRPGIIKHQTPRGREECAWRIKNDNPHAGAKGAPRGGKDAIRV